MAKTSINIKPCLVTSSGAHNRRLAEYLANIRKEKIYIRTDLMAKNETWVSPELGDTSLEEHNRQIAAMVKKKTGRAMQTKDRERVNKKTGKVTVVRGSTPIKEGVVVIKEDTTMEQLRHFCEVCKERWGITPLQIFIHRDEGHYETPNDKTTWKPNYHAHIVWDWMDHDTGKSCKLLPQDMSEMQTLLAECLEMQRGISKKITGKEHLERTDYIIAKQKQEAEKTRIAKERAEAELKTVKGELRTEKLKSAAAEVGSNIVEGIGALVGTSKVKRQQQQIDDLAKENERLHSEIKRQNKTIDRERREHEQAAKRLQGEIDRIYGWFPDTPQLVKWGEYCRSLGFTDKMARDLVNMRPVRFSGKLYSREHSQHFETEHSEARLLRDEKGPGGFQLFIDQIPILKWFRQKTEEFLERLGIKIKDREQDRGMRMR